LLRIIVFSVDCDYLLTYLPKEVKFFHYETFTVYYQGSFFAVIYVEFIFISEFCILSSFVLW